MRHLLLSPLSLALALAVCELGSNASAAERLAAPPEFLTASSSARWQAVGDDVLSLQTGKGAGGTMVSGLVLDMLSQWQMPNGGSASAHGTLTVSTNANNSLSAQVTTSAQASDGGRGHGHANGVGNGNGIGNAAHGGSATTSIAPVGSSSDSRTGTGSVASTGATATAGVTGTGANPQASATGGQNVSVNGVSQITQVAGNGNAGANSTVIDFNGAGAATRTSNAGPGQGTNTNTSAAAGANAPTATATSASGNVKAGISFANGGVVVTLQTPAGIATQTISPALAQSGGSIAQLLQITGNGQAVVNQLKLSIQTLPMSGALMRQLGVLQALQNSALLRR